jgi:hypothetical protein
MLKTTLVLDDLFDPEKGWTFPPRQVPIERSAADDGTPTYLLRVDGYPVIVYEQTEWADGFRSSVSAMRICFAIDSGIVVVDALPIAEATLVTSGPPAFGVDDDGEMAVVYALPFSEDFPLEFLRKQLVVAIGLGVQEIREAQAGVDEEERAKPAARWNQAREVASVAGTFARAFFLN